MFSPKSFFSPKTKFSPKTMFSPKLCFPQKMCFYQNICFLPKNIFSQKKTWFHLKTCVQKKKVFLKKSFHKNTCFHQKKIKSNGFKNQQSKQKVDHGFDLWSCFFLQFLRFFLFLPVSSLFSSRLFFKYTTRSLARIALALFCSIIPLSQHHKDTIFLSTYITYMYKSG